MDRDEYERDLRRRQAEHLKHVKGGWDYRAPWSPCAHDACSECVGTGVKRDGSVCIHGISCQCPKCSPYCGTF